jgi:two-component system sensor histidine kinase KdpD
MPWAALRVPMEKGYHRLFRHIISDAENDSLRHHVMSVLAAFAGVAAASIVIGLIEHVVHVSNISLLYLPVVIWLAIAFGRIAVITGSILAFLAYDFFFIPPVHLLTVDDPTEWLSLSALLLIGLVVGQLTGEVRQRERIAVASQQRTAILYELAQDIASNSEQSSLLAGLAKRTVTVFASSGVEACGIWLPAGEHLALQATAHAPTRSTHLHLDTPEQQIQAEIAQQTRRVTTSLDPGGIDPHLLCFIPLLSSGRVVGVLCMVGRPAMTSLLTQHRFAGGAAEVESDGAPLHGQASLLAAFCDQMALALDRAALQQEAIHAEAIRESDRLKNALLGSVTHDLRTPIAVIQAASSSLEQADITWSEDERHELLETIDVSVDRLARMVDNLLALSRLEAAASPPIKTIYPINDVIATVLDQLEVARVAAGRPISVDIAEDPLEAPMDHAAIERVVQNLVENAIKYSPPGSPIAIRAWRANDAVEVTVSDQGIGIPAAQLEAIFDKFYRLQQPMPWTRVTPSQGTGLGLAICAGIIREHDGHIWAESREGHGATFHFTLPLVPADTNEAAPAMLAQEEVSA